MTAEEGEKITAFHSNWKERTGTAQFVGYGERYLRVRGAHLSQLPWRTEADTARADDPTVKNVGVVPS